MKRFITILGSCLAAAVSLGAAGTPPPNILFVLADDLRWDAMSCAGHPLLRTPNLDRLAARGVRFENAFVTTSICCVSRASVLTGQYARRHGVHDFATPLPDLEATYPALLRRAGYTTGFIGKWGIAASDRAWFQRCAGAFDFWAGDLGQTSYWHERTCNYLTNNGTTDREDFFCSCPAEAQRAQGTGKQGPHPSLKQPVHAETEFVPAKIRSFLDQRDPGKPFCLSVSLKAPHGPWSGYAPRFSDDFENDNIPRRENATLEEALRQPAFLRQSLESDRGLRFVQDPGLSGERARLMRHYYRLILGLDDCVGQMLAELERRGLADNTVIVFTSDNGHFAGEHGFFGKWLMHEESLRVPLLICDPRLPAERRGKTSAAMALNIDIAPTVLELAGSPIPPAMQGHSLLAVCQDPKAPSRDRFFYEHLYEHQPKPPMHIEPCEGVRTRDWKYIRYTAQTGPECEQLYHLAADPLEMRNRINDPAAAAMLKELRADYERLRKDLGPHRTWTRPVPKSKAKS